MVADHSELTNAVGNIFHFTCSKKRCFCPERLHVGALLLHILYWSAAPPYNYILKRCFYPTWVISTTTRRVAVTLLTPTRHIAVADYICLHILICFFMIYTSLFPSRMRCILRRKNNMQYLRDSLGGTRMRRLVSKK